MGSLTEKQRCEFAENALAERQAILAEWHQREQRFARWIAHQRRRNDEDVQLLLLRQLKEKVKQRVAQFAKQKPRQLSFLDFPQFRRLTLRNAPISEQRGSYIVPLPDLPAFRGEPLDTRFLNLRG